MKKTTAHGRKLARMASNGAGHIQLPVTIRFFAKDETALQLTPQAMLDMFREGTATEPEWHTLAMRLNWGRFLARDHFEDAVPTMAAAQEALRAIKECADRVGKWGISQPEFAAIGAGLNLTDNMQLQCTRRELRDAMRDMLGANEYARKTNTIKQRLDGAQVQP